jgi:serpin B
MMQYSSNQDVTLSLANSVWANQTIQFNDEYINNAVNYYEADVESLDFADENSVGVINGWCNEKTEGLIPEIVNDKMLQESDAMLINALYFNGKWADQFAHSEVIENSDFTNADGDIEKVTMMYGSVDTYYENDEAVAFAKYYEGDQIAFIGILPKEEGDYKVSDLKLDELLASVSYQDVDIVMPKFIVEDTNDLTDSVKAAGLNDLFGPSADFSLMSDNQVAIDTIIQKTYVDVNEEGTEATAVTAVSMKTTAMMTEDEAKFIKLDRPFTFMIYDVVNDECLFIGNVKTLQ